MSNTQYKQYPLADSIVTQSDISVILATDKEEPLTFKAWRSQSGLSDSNDPSLRETYDLYLTEWRRVKKKIIAEKNKNTIELYSAFLKELDIDLTQDERRYIDNIDYTDSVELETCLGFFIKKIKNISQYFSSQRDKLKFEVVRNSLKGSNKGVGHDLYNQVINLLYDESFIVKHNLTTSVRDSMIQELRVNIIELYDIDPNYGDPLHSVEHDKENVTEHALVSEIKYDPFLFIDDTIAKQNLLNSYDVVLSDDDSDVTTNESAEIELSFDIPLDDIVLLPDSEFIQYDKTDLNLDNVKRLVALSTGTETSYLSAGASGEYVTGTLFNSSQNIQNIHNRHKPNVNVVQSSKTRTVQQLGGFFKPSKLGSLNYYSFNPKPKILKEHITPGKLYVHHDLSSGSNRLDLPVDYFEDVSNLKYNTLESAQVGEITTQSSNIQKFYNYQSREQTNIFSVHGISRKDDSFDFWSGDVDDIWANSDVFPLDVPNIYTFDSRQQAQLVNRGHTYTWKSDPFGNEYAVFKKIKPFQTLTVDDFAVPESSTRCDVLDGDIFILGSQQEPLYTRTVNFLESESNSQFTSDGFEYTSVRNGSTFYLPGCDFTPLVDETLVVQTKELQGNRVYCDTIDGFTMSFCHADRTSPEDSYCGRYELYSRNTGNDIDKNPPVDETWDGGKFDQTCVPRPNTEVFYYVDTPELFTDDTYEYDGTELVSGDMSESVDLSSQQEMPGELMVRTADSGDIDIFENTCKAMFLRYTSNSSSENAVDIQDQIRNHLLDIDIINDILIIKTVKNYILDKISYDFDSNTIIPISNPYIIDRSPTTSDYYYNDEAEEIVICTLSTELIPTSTAAFAGENKLSAAVTVIDVNTFTAKKLSPDVLTGIQNNIIVDGIELIPVAISNISTPKIAVNESNNRYYITYTCLTDTGTGSGAFTIGQVITDNITGNQYLSTLYVSPKPALFTEDMTDDEREIINRASRIVTDTTKTLTELITLPDGQKTKLSVDTPPIANRVTFQNSPYGELAIDVSNILPGKTVTKIDIWYGDGNVIQLNNPDHTIHRSPVPRYDDFDTLIGHDTRDPRSYLIKHKYITQTGDVTGSGDVDRECYIAVYTAEQNPQINLPGVYVYRVIVSQRAQDITTIFNNIQIHDTRVYTDKYGVENLMVTFLTKEPDYISSVILRLDTPIREMVRYTRDYGSALKIDRDIDMERIRLAISQ